MNQIGTIISKERKIKSAPVVELFVFWCWTSIIRYLNRTVYHVTQLWNSWWICVTTIFHVGTSIHIRTSSYIVTVFYALLFTRTFASIHKTKNKKTLIEWFIAASRFRKVRSSKHAWTCLPMLIGSIIIALGTLVSVNDFGQYTRQCSMSERISIEICIGFA